MLSGGSSIIQLISVKSQDSSPGLQALCLNHTESWTIHSFIQQLFVKHLLYTVFARSIILARDAVGKKTQSLP